MKTRAAFTMIELLVAIAVTVVMILFVNSIFSTAGGAISTGVAASQVLETSIVISEQIDRDAKSMLGPRQGGFLVILNKIYKDIPVGPNDPDPDEVSGTQKTILPDPRSDQVYWVAQRGTLKPMTPGGLDHDPLNHRSSAAFVRMWYGHVARTYEKGGSAPDLGEGIPSDPNRRAIDWILGRQALLLDPSVDPMLVHAETAKVNADVKNLDTELSRADKLFRGTTDVARQSLSSIQADFRKAASTTTTTSNLNDFEASTVREYLFADRRLDANPSPDIEGEYDLGHVAQMHPVFVEHVSEFEVTFAGDYDDKPGIDLYTGAEANPAIGRFEGAIRWYDGETDPPTRLDTQKITAPLGNGYVFVPFGSNWPHMIRLRFRVHDARGRVGGQDGIPGQIFEQIIQIPR